MRRLRSVSRLRSPGSSPTSRSNARCSTRQADSGTTMRLHILGICGTFMGGIAALARELGHDVEGSDANVYPPMSTQLERLGIALRSGWKAEHLEPAPDLVIVGNALSRGNPA